MKKLLFCTHKVNRANIKREPRKGVEHIILTSFTLPPNIVMNGGLYSTEERNKSFETLNRTPVTVEHPEIDGVFVSANDPETDFDFRFGAFNENARITDDNRIALDKVINVQKALKTEKGKRLLDRIGEVETNEDARPIHTSVGVWLDVEEVELSTNDRGQEYTWLAKDMIFDHDAILLDSIGASTPDQGTGIGINKENVKVEHYICGEKKKGYKIPKKFQEKAKKIHPNNKDTTFSEIFEELDKLINKDIIEGESRNWLRHDSVDFDSFVFETPSGELFKSNYVVDELGNIDIQDTRLPVERVVEYRPINPTGSEEDSAMRDTIIEELGKLGITVNADISDADLLAKHKEALSTNEDEDENKELSELVKNAVSTAIDPLNKEISDLKTTITKNSDKELKELAVSIVASKKYPGLDESDIESLGPDKAKAMAANCGISHGIGSTMHVNDDEPEAFETKVDDLPE